MMKPIRLTTFLSLLSLCISCKKPFQSDENTSTISLSEPREIPMSEIITKIEYVALPDNFNFFFVDKILSAKGLYFFCDFGHTYKIAILDKEFKLVGTIENYGSGPGEYQNIKDACINTSKYTLDILSGNKLLRFDFSGNFIEEFKFPFILSKLEHRHGDEYIVHIHPGVKSAYANNKEALDRNLLFTWDSKTDELSPILPNPYKHPLPFISEPNILKRVKNDYFFTKSFTDTIYWVKDNKVHKKYHLEFRDKMLPLKLLQEKEAIDVLNNPNTKERYIYHFARLFANEDYLITSYLEKSSSVLIYNRKNHKSISASKFENDIDHGPNNFHPKFLQDNIIFGSYAPEILMEHYQKHLDQLRGVDNSFTKMAKQLNRDSGSVLVLYHLK